IFSNKSFTYSTSEYRDAFIEICTNTNTPYKVTDTQCNPEFDNWYLQTEAVNLIMSNKIKKEKELPVPNLTIKNDLPYHLIINNCSLTNIVEAEIKIKHSLLPCKIGLCCEYINENSEWTRKMISVMRTIGDFQNTINSL